MSMLKGNYIILKNDIAVGMGSQWFLNIAHYHNCVKIIYYDLKINFMMKISIDLPVSIIMCFIFLKNEKLYFLKSCLIFLGSVLCQFLKKSIFLLACWFLAKNLTKFESPKQNLHDPPDINVDSGTTLNFALTLTLIPLGTWVQSP